MSPGGTTAAPGTGSASTDGGDRSTSTATGRIGVAIPVPEPLGPELQRWRAEFGDPLAWSVPAHVTLVPPMEAAGELMPVVHEHLARAASMCRPFTIRLRGTDTFRPVSPVVFARVEQGAEQVAEVEQRVRDGVLASERRFPFHPHVTLAHEVADDALDRAGETLCDLEASFDVTCFLLYRHGDDGVWRPAREYPLGEPPT